MCIYICIYIYICVYIRVYAKTTNWCRARRCPAVQQQKLQSSPWLTTPNMTTTWASKDFWSLPLHNERPYSKDFWSFCPLGVRAILGWSLMWCSESVSSQGSYSPEDSFCSTDTVTHTHAPAKKTVLLTSCCALSFYKLSWAWAWVWMSQPSISPGSHSSGGAKRWGYIKGWGITDLALLQRHAHGKVLLLCCYPSLQPGTTHKLPRPPLSSPPLDTSESPVGR